MQIDVEKYLLQQLNKVIKGSKSYGNIPFAVIKHFNSFAINYKCTDVIKEKYSNHKVFYNDFDLTDIITSYEPFMNAVREMYFDSDINDLNMFFQECDIYPLHLDIFKAYFNNEELSRNEEYIVNEIDYEKQKMIQAIVNMLEYLADKKPVIFVLEKLHRAESSTIDIICELIKRKSSNIIIVASYNKMCDIPDYLAANIEKMNELFIENACIYEWGFDTPISIGNTDHMMNVNSGRIIYYLRVLNDMYYSLALEQANHFASIIHHKLLMDEMDITPPDKFRFYELYAKIAIVVGDTSASIIACDTIEKLIGEYPSSFRKFKYLCLKTYTYLYSGKKKLAENFSEQCLKEAMITKDEYLLFKARLLLHMVRFSGWNDMWLGELEEQIDEKLIEQVKLYKYNNHLAHIYIYACDSNPALYEKVDGIDERLIFFSQGIQIAQQMKNGSLLLAAYRKNLMIASTNGFFDVSRYYAVEKIQPLVRSMKNYFEEGNVYNDLGYNACATEKYSMANEYFNKALQIFIDLNKPEFIGETLYNMSMNSIMAGEYAFALECLNLVMDINNIYHLESLRVAHVSKLFGLIALCEYMTGDKYEAQINVNFAGQFLKHIIHSENSDKLFSYWDDDLFFYHMCTGLLAFDENDYVKAINEYKKAYKFGGPNKGGGVFYYSLYAKAMYKLYEAIGDKERAENTINECIEYYDSKNYCEKQKELKAFMSGTDYVKNYEIKFASLNIKNSIFEILKNTRSDYEIKNYRDKVRYLSSWQKLHNIEFANTKALINNSADSLMNEFNLDHMIIVKLDDYQPKVLYQNIADDVDPKVIAQLTEYFRKHRRIFSASKLDRNFFEYDKVSAILNENYLCAILGVPIFKNESLAAYCVAYILMNDNWGAESNSIVVENSSLVFFELLFRQLMGTVDKVELDIKINDQNAKINELNYQLKNIAILDQLTGLYNRQGFSDLINEEVKNAQDERRNLKLAIVYCDLDKFKYCNDNFGHKAGDVVLVEFAKMLQNVSRNIGYAIRYSGDEFILMLKTSDYNEVMDITERIYAMLNHEDSYISAVEKSINKKVLLNKSDKISASMGVAFVDGEPSVDLVNEAIMNADKALYYVKKHGKRRCCFYNENIEE